MEPRGVGEDFFFLFCLFPPPKSERGRVRGQAAKFRELPFLFSRAFLFFCLCQVSPEGLECFFFLFVACLFGLLKLERAEGCIFGGRKSGEFFSLWPV